MSMTVSVPMSVPVTVSVVVIMSVTVSVASIAVIWGVPVTSRKSSSHVEDKENSNDNADDVAHHGDAVAEAGEMKMERCLRNK